MTRLFWLQLSPTILNSSLGQNKYLALKQDRFKKSKIFTSDHLFYVKMGTMWDNNINRLLILNWNLKPYLLMGKWPIQPLRHNDDVAGLKSLKNCEIFQDFKGCHEEPIKMLQIAWKQLSKWLNALYPTGLWEIIANFWKITTMLSCLILITVSRFF